MPNRRSANTRLGCALQFVLVLLLTLVLSSTCSTEASRDSSNDQNSINNCPCQLLDRPDLWKKELVARWMVHSLDWGVVTTISSRLQLQLPGQRKQQPTPFGNVYSFVDGPCEGSTGTPYFYGTYMDQTFQDIKSNPAASLTLSEASFASVCGADVLPACSISFQPHHKYYGDAENPICARLTLTGSLVEVDKDSDEYVMALEALYQRHKQMESWPADHGWVIAKLDIQDIWFIDYFDGANILNVDDYFAAQLIPSEVDESH